MELWYEGRVLLDQIEIADTFWKRLKGLMGRKSLDRGTGLLLIRCGSVHTCFMRFPITVVYMDKDLNVLEMEDLEPWRAGKRVKGAKNVLELNTGILKEESQQVLEIGK